MSGETSIYDSDNCNQFEIDNIDYISKNDDECITIINFPGMLNDEIDECITNSW